MFASDRRPGMFDAVTNNTFNYKSLKHLQQVMQGLLN